jgi:hypothetical protein
VGDPKATEVREPLAVFGKDRQGSDNEVASVTFVRAVCKKSANGLVKLDAALDEKLEAAASDPERNRHRRIN